MQLIVQALMQDKIAKFKSVIKIVHSLHNFKKTCLYIIKNIELLK